MRRIVPVPMAQSGAPPAAASTRRRHRWLPWLLVVVLLEAIAGGGLLGAGALTKSPSGVAVTYARVPRVVGLDVASATAALKKAGLAPVVAGWRYSARVPAGHVILQRPVKGRRERQNTVVKMVVSKGRHPTSLPSLNGLTEAQAVAALQGAHLVGHFTTVYSETVAAGKVVSTTSAADKLFYGDPVKVVISKGLAPQTIPADLSGGVVKWAQAQAALKDLHLQAKEQLVYSTTISAGFVVSTEPLPGTSVPGHSTVVVLTSEGPPFVKVPPLFADSLSVAEGHLRALGLEYRVYGPQGAGFVLNSVPGPGTPVRVGSTINLYAY